MVTASEGLVLPTIPFSQDYPTIAGLYEPTIIKPSKMDDSPTDVDALAAFKIEFPTLEEVDPELFAAPAPPPASTLKHEEETEATIPGGQEPGKKGEVEEDGFQAAVMRFHLALIEVTGGSDNREACGRMMEELAAMRAEMWIEEEDDPVKVRLGGGAGWR